MHFLLPWALLGLVAIGGLVVAYRLHARHRDRTVPALFLWGRESVMAESGRRRDRLKTPPLFFLELLALVLLAVAAAEPCLRRGAPPAPVVLFDTSPSMRARLPDGSTPASRALTALRRDLARIDPLAVRLVTTEGQQGLLPPEEALQRLDAWRRENAATGAAEPSDRLALADSLRTPGGELLVYSDHAPAEDVALPPGTRFRAFGEPVPNAAISAAFRSFDAEWRDTLLLRVEAYGMAAPAVRILDAETGRPVPGPGPLAATNGIVSTILPKGTADLVASLPEDALDEGSIRLPRPERHRPVVALDLPADDPLRGPFAAAIRAAGGEIADEFSLPPSMRIADAERASALDAIPCLRLHRATGGVSVRPALASSHPILDGLAFEGLAWPGGGTNALPGRPLLYAGSTPIFSEERTHSAAPVFHLLAPKATADFYRSPAFPGLVVNLLALAAPDTGGTAATALAPDADLTHLSSCDLRTPGARDETALASLRPVAAPFGIAAALLLALRAFLLRFRPQ